MTTAASLISRLGLAPHPEGGWYRETFRQPTLDAESARGLATAILFLLEEGQRSHWHRVDAAELWLWHAGSPLTLRIAGETAQDHLLGGNIMAGEVPQAIVPPHAWQSAEAHLGWTLVSCVVTPAFEFAGFELAPPGWEPDALKT